MHATHAPVVLAIHKKLFLFYLHDHSVSDSIAPAWLATLVVELITLEKQLYFRLNFKIQPTDDKSSCYKTNYKTDQSVRKVDESTTTN